jgi:hypothetical protein
MSILSSANIAEAPAHAVLDGAQAYDVVGFSYSAASAPYGTLDLVLKKTDATVSLRFEGVHELEVDCGFPHGSVGIDIRDVSYLGWENARVRVHGAEDDSPAIRFWAKEVRRVAA